VPTQPIDLSCFSDRHSWHGDYDKAYSASKFAVVNISEGLAKQVAPLGIGVTVLCPGFVRTRIFESGRNRPERYGPAQAPDPGSPAGRLAARQAELGRLGLDPIDVAAQVLTAIRENELYVFTHAGAEWRAELKDRFEVILRAMDKAAASGRVIWPVAPHASRRHVPDLVLLTVRSCPFDGVTPR
jgi:short-subunit dehydrogenase